MGRNHSHKNRASNSTMFPSAENHFVIRPGAGIDKLQARIPTSGTNSGYTDPTKKRLSIDQKIDQSAIDRINAFRRPAQGPAYVPQPPPANPQQRNRRPRYNVLPRQRQGPVPQAPPSSADMAQFGRQAGIKFKRERENAVDLLPQVGPGLTRRRILDGGMEEFEMQQDFRDVLNPPQAQLVGEQATAAPAGFRFTPAGRIIGQGRIVMADQRPEVQVAIAEGARNTISRAVGNMRQRAADLRARALEAGISAAQAVMGRARVAGRAAQTLYPASFAANI